MHRIVFGLIIIVLSSVCAAKETHFIDISDEIYGEITREQEGEVFSRGKILVLNKKTKSVLIAVESEELTLELHDGKAVANIMQLPYGEQSVIIHEDFNFDGKKDLAIMDGQNSCYHGPSFKVYLYNDKERSKYRLSNEFTRLAQEYCGMFNADAESKLIHTMTKSGCCWHQFSTFSVVGNKPFAISIEEEDGFNAPLNIHTSYRWDGNKMRKTKDVSFIPDAEFVPVLSFDLKNKKASIVMFNPCCDILVYAFVNKDGGVDLLYPNGDFFGGKYSKKDVFEYEESAGLERLKFSNAAAEYVVYKSPNNTKVGVMVKVGGRKYKLEGEPKSIKGSLGFSAKDFVNVIVE